MSDRIEWQTGEPPKDGRWILVMFMTYMGGIRKIEHSLLKYVNENEIYNNQKAGWINYNNYEILMDYKSKGRLPEKNSDSTMIFFELNTNDFNKTIIDTSGTKPFIMPILNIVGWIELGIMNKKFK